MGKYYHRLTLIDLKSGMIIIKKRIPIILALPLLCYVA